MQYAFFDSNSKIQGNFENLSQFCRENNLNESCARDVVHGKQKQHRGMYIKLSSNNLNLEELYDLHTLPRTPTLKIKKTKQDRYSQSIEWLDFLSNCNEYHEKYYIKENLSCAEIGKIFKMSAESIRIQFKKSNLKIHKNSRLTSSNKGQEHYAFKRMSKSQRAFLNNFKEIFEREHNEEKLSIYSISEKYNLCRTTIFNYARQHNCEYSRANVSKPHQIVLDFLKSQEISFVINDRQAIKPKEIDIFLPEYNLGIEVNGVYWHGESKMGRKYHLDKHILCEKAGVRLLQIFDDEIIENPEICKSIILSALGKSERVVYGRKTILRKITNKESSSFLEDNHIQGNRSASIRYGLFFDDQLISVMTFAIDKKYQYQLIRLCTKIGVNCVGGASKLFSAFKKEYKPKSTVSYCDKRIFGGTVYTTLGFTQKKDSAPNYYYFKMNNCIRESRLKFQKHKLNIILNTFDPLLTEWENMQKHNYDRIWDCGNKVFVWTAQ